MEKVATPSLLVFYLQGAQNFQEFLNQDPP